MLSSDPFVTSLQTDTNGNIAEQYEYDAFGYPYFFDANGTNLGYSPWGNRFLFTGREWLSDLKLYDYRNRLYNPELGRFIQPDPKEFAAGDYNLYRYCHNDPINKTDPLGLDVSALPYWDGANILQAKGFRYAWAFHQGELGRLLVTAHGAPGGAMNTSVTESVKNTVKTINDVPASMRWTPEQIVAAVTADKSYKVDSIIELDICYGADPGPDGKSLQEKVANLLPSTNTVLASHGLISPSDGKAKNRTPQVKLPGQKKTDDKK